MWASLSSELRQLLCPAAWFPEHPRPSCSLPVLTGFPLSHRPFPTALLDSNWSPFQSSLSPPALRGIAPLDLFLGPSVIPRIIFRFAKSSQWLRNAFGPTFDFFLYFSSGLSVSF